MAEVASILEIDALIAAGAPVAIGVSGGKDSQAAALATIAYLDDLKHTGPRILVHSDLGVVEWADSLPVCERLAAHLGIELVTLRRGAGDMMDRWEARWESSKRRYANLETVTLVLPWSTPSMRFCTSELKTQLIGAALRKRFGKVYINVTGVRREESKARAQVAIASAEKGGASWTWRPIVRWTLAETFAYVAAAGLDVHEAYTTFGMSRVSCRFCIMSNIADLANAATDAASIPILRRMVELEIASTFAFQGSRWLGDVAPQNLTEDQRQRLAAAKLKGIARVAAEKRITKGMLYVKGWPARMLTDDEAAILADVRYHVSGMLGIDAKHMTVPSIHARYAELMHTSEMRRAA